MRRHARHVLTIVTLLSLLVCLAACVMWVRSHWRNDSASYTSSAWRWWSVRSRTGAVLVSVGHAAGMPARRGEWKWESRPARQSSGMFRTWRFAGFFGEDFTNTWSDGRTTRSQAFGTPYWAIVAATATLPAARATQLFIRRRRRPPPTDRRCPSCGYDLRATPGRCPECGSRRESKVTTRLSACARRCN